MLMRTLVVRLTIAALLLGLFNGACTAAPPSLCTSEEKVYLTARLYANDGSAPVRDNEAVDAPVVSLCLGGAERAPHLVLRQGRIGDTQTVIRSGPRQRFYTFTLIDHPKFGREIVWTRVGSTEYCVSSALGRGRGVGFDIFVDSQWKQRLFSGIETGVTYELTEDVQVLAKVKSLLRKGRLTSCT